MTEIGVFFGHSMTAKVLDHSELKMGPKLQSIEPFLHIKPIKGLNGVLSYDQ